MVRHLVVALGTLALIACASQGADEVDTSSANLDESVPVNVIHAEHAALVAGHTDAAISTTVRKNVDLTGIREARVVEVQSADGSTHLVVQSLVANQHKVNVTRIDVDAALVATRITPNYRRLVEDQTGAGATTHYTCPDPTVQFLSWCPNNDTLEIKVTNDVATAAKAAGLKTVTLLKAQATHDAVLNYLACPNLIGNFYDGDANTSEMVTYNGQITADEFTSSVNFRSDVTNIWLACEAYNDPMLTAVQKTAKSQKYAAGINDLEVGPSDNAAACAMKAAITGKPMTQAFQDCYKQLDNTANHWGFGGDGSDYLGKEPGYTPSAPSSSTSDN